MLSSNSTAPAAQFLVPVLSPAPADQQESARVYLIANPLIRESPAWPGILADLAKRIKGATFATYADLFTSNADYRARWAGVAGQFAGAVVIPRPVGPRLMLGLAAVREATDISAAGKPVLIHSRKGLFRWAQADIKIHGKSAGRFRAELVITGDAR